MTVRHYYFTLTKTRFIASCYSTAKHSVFSFIAITTTNLTYQTKYCYHLQYTTRVSYYRKLKFQSDA